MKEVMEEIQQKDAREDVKKMAQVNTAEWFFCVHNLFSVVKCCALMLRWHRLFLKHIANSLCCYCVLLFFVGAISDVWIQHSSSASFMSVIMVLLMLVLLVV
jgi:hypothetical protein